MSKIFILRTDATVDAWWINSTFFFFWNKSILHISGFSFLTSMDIFFTNAAPHEGFWAKYCFIKIKQLCFISNNYSSLKVQQ